MHKPGAAGDPAGAAEVQVVVGAAVDCSAGCVADGVEAAAVAAEAAAEKAVTVGAVAVLAIAARVPRSQAVDARITAKAPAAIPILVIIPKPLPKLHSIVTPTDMTIAIVRIGTVRSPPIGITRARIRIVPIATLQALTRHHSAAKRTRRVIALVINRPTTIVPRQINNCRRGGGRNIPLDQPAGVVAAVFSLAASGAAARFRIEHAR